MNLRPPGARCGECPFAVKGCPPHRPVFGVGPDDAEGLLVAESPGDEEVEIGRPLVGVTGRQLDEELAEAGIKRSRLFIINAILCQPPRGASEHDRAAACDACRPAFLHQLRKLEPTIPVLAMGRWAHYQLRQTAKGVMDERGFIRREFKLPRGP